MTALLDLQIASEINDLPSEEVMLRWINQVFEQLSIDDKEITIRVVDEAESQQLNYQYRSKNAPTNVLSFEFEMPDFVGLEDADGNHLANMDLAETEFNLIGDLVICAPIVALEAQQQNKNLLHHWAHMVVHGTLHLLGYDHIDEVEADYMEGLERQILLKLAIDDPYQNH